MRHKRAANNVVYDNGCTLKQQNTNTTIDIYTAPSPERALPAALGVLCHGMATGTHRARPTAQPGGRTRKERLPRPSLYPAPISLLRALLKAGAPEELFETRRGARILTHGLVSRLGCTSLFCTNVCCALRIAFNEVVLHSPEVAKVLGVVENLVVTKLLFNTCTGRTQLRHGLGGRGALITLMVPAERILLPPI